MWCLVVVPGKDEDIHLSMGVSQPYRLTYTLIEKLQNYYGIAIRNNCGNLEGMKAAIYDSIIHCVSSKKRNLHTCCGPDSWCRFKQDKTNNTDLYKCGRDLPDNIIAQIRPIYDRLSSNDLFSLRSRRYSRARENGKLEIPPAQKRHILSSPRQLSAGAF
jgi:hypothetical protein